MWRNVDKKRDKKLTKRDNKWDILDPFYVVFSSHRPKLVKDPAQRYS